MRNKIMIIGIALVFVGCGSNENSSSQTKSPSMPAPIEATKLANQSQIDEGLQQLRDSDIPGAIKNFDDAIKVNPADPQGYLVLGQTYLRLKEYDRAIDTFSAASRVAPEEGEIYYLLAVSHGLAGNNDLARENAEKSVQIFQSQKNEEKFVRSVALLKGLSDVQ